jgi:hypothetical protein
MSGIIDSCEGFLRRLLSTSYLVKQIGRSACQAAVAVTVLVCTLLLSLRFFAEPSRKPKRTVHVIIGMQDLLHLEAKFSDTYLGFGFAGRAAIE